MKPEFSRQIFGKYPNIRFHENPYSGSGVVPDWRAEVRTDRHDKLIVAFRNFANAPKNPSCVINSRLRSWSTSSPHHRRGMLWEWLYPIADIVLHCFSCSSRSVSSYGLWAGLSENRRLIPRRDNRFVSCLKPQDRLWDLLLLLSSGYRVKRFIVRDIHSCPLYPKVKKDWTST